MGENAGKSHLHHNLGSKKKDEGGVRGPIIPLQGTSPLPKALALWSGSTIPNGANLETKPSTRGPLVNIQYPNYSKSLPKLGSGKG
jgi:hypothetical protein